MKKCIILIGTILIIANLAYGQQYNNSYRIVNQIQTFVGYGKTPLQAKANTPGAKSSLGRVQMEHSSQIAPNIWAFKRSVLMPTLKPIYSGQNSKNTGNIILR